MKQRSLSLSLLFLTLAPFLQSCKKDSADNGTLILGRWTLINRIERWTTTDPSTNARTVVSDTLQISTTGNDSYIEFRRDTLNGYIRIRSQITDLISVPYTLSRDELTFYHNPFTTHGPPDTELRTVKIKQLSERELVLYDVDTWRASPLSMYEVWFNFRK